MTDHFTLPELTFSQEATRRGINNEPSKQILVELAHTREKLEEVRSLLGYPMHVNSGYRCEALERILCAKDYAAWCKRHGHALTEVSWRIYFMTKAHPQGFAVDFTCAGYGTPAEVVKAIAASGIKFDQLIEEGTWVHISFSPLMRQRVLYAKFGPDGTPTYAKTN